LSAPDLRLIVITDAPMASPQQLSDVVADAVAAGAPCIQLRDKRATARDLLEQANILLPVVRAGGALLIINDRLDVAMLAGADGVHLGPDDLPVREARRVAPPGFIIGRSTDDPILARQAGKDGATYIGCGAVFGTTSKPGAGDERIGTERLDEVAQAARIPVVGIGGITTANVALVADTAAAGAAVIGAVMMAADVGPVVRSLLAPFGKR
jgi:thiamine-phosphate pyrophosphorylase